MNEATLKNELIEKSVEAFRRLITEYTDPNSLRHTLHDLSIHHTEMILFDTDNLHKHSKDHLYNLSLVLKALEGEFND
jgi:hypothetical protein